jgi:hypothetical protein
MPTFVIDVENKVTACVQSGPVHIPKGGGKFASSEELAKLAAGWPGTRLVEIWNKLPKVKAVRKFTDRRTAVRRIWEAVQNLKPSSTEPNHTIVPGSGRKLPKSGRAAGRDGTKAERIITLLERPSGATLDEIMAETGWQPHSVRGFISGQLSKRLGLRIKSFKRASERVYRIY